MTTNRVVFQLCVLSVFLYGIYAAPQKGTVTKKKWDYLTFTQTWPPVSCLSWQILDPKHKCNLTEKITTWTVHGIWPSSAESDDPSFCNKSLPFNSSEIQEIKPDLDKYWANVYAHTPEDQLWEHEWDKHGTCAATLPELNTELRFFKQGLAWAKQFNMLNVLKNAGITPSSETPIVAYDIENAVQNVLHVKPLLVCEYISSNKSRYIYEIEICFDKTLQLMNCPTNALDSSPKLLGAERCPRDALVWYPPMFHEDKTQKKPQTNSEPDLLRWFKAIQLVNSLF